MDGGVRIFGSLHCEHEQRVRSDITKMQILNCHNVPVILLSLSPIYVDTYVDGHESQEWQMC